MRNLVNYIIFCWNLRDIQSLKFSEDPKIKCDIINYRHGDIVDFSQFNDIIVFGLGVVASFVHEGFD